MYIITNLRTGKQTNAHSLGLAKESVDRWHESSGDHYDIVETKTVYTTYTLAELFEEEEQKNAA